MNNATQVISHLKVWSFCFELCYLYLTECAFPFYFRMNVDCIDFLYGLFTYRLKASI